MSEYPTESANPGKRSPLPEGGTTTDTTSEMARRKRKHHHRSKGSAQKDEDGNLINVEECDSQDYSSVAAGPGTARARTNSQSTNSYVKDAEQRQQQQQQQEPAPTAPLPVVVMQDVRPEDNAASTGNTGRRNSPLPPLAGSHSGQPTPPSGGSDSEARSPRRPSNAASGAYSRLGEQDITLNGATPPHDGGDVAFSPRSDAGQPVEESVAAGATTTTAIGATKPAVDGGCVKPRTAAAASATSESRSLTSGTNDGAAAAKHAAATGTVTQSSGNTDHHPAGDRGVEQYEDLDQNPPSDVESDDEAFQAVKQPCASCCVDRSDPDSWRYRKPRKSGIELPFHLNQLAAFVVFFVGDMFYYTGTVPGYVLLFQDGYKNMPEMIVGIAATTPFMLSFAISWIVLTFYEAGDYENEGEMCTYCERRTAKDSKHCKACNKCVSGFDHHCKWLNVCIGKKNYKLFLVYVTSCFLMILTSMACSIVLLAKWWHELENFNAYFRVAPILFIVLMLVSTYPVAHLFFFHIMLNVRGLTTYQYILLKREQRLNRNAAPQNPAKKERRLFSLSKKSKKQKEAAAAVNATQAGSGNQLELELARAAAAMRGD